MSNTSQVWQKCLKITDDTKNHALNNFFYTMPDNLRKAYATVVERPIDFDTIKKNLTKNAYPTPLDWYNDMELVYKNGLAYHKNNPVWYAVTQYCYDDFKKKTTGIADQDMQKWYNNLTEKMQELSKIIANGPIPQGLDPLLTSVVRKAEQILPPSPQIIAEFVEKINRLVVNEGTKKEILYILGETQPDLKIEGEQMEINADTLSPNSLNALLLYANVKG